MTQSDRSAGDILGFVVSGDVTKADYDVSTPAVEAAVEERGTVKLLLGLTDFRWEKVGAWGADLHFGPELHGKVALMAILDHEKWDEHLATNAWVARWSFASLAPRTRQPDGRSSDVSERCRHRWDR